MILKDSIVKLASALVQIPLRAGIDDMGAIHALSGFGVSYSNIHATDESVDIGTILPVYEVYRRAIENIMQARLPEKSPSGWLGD